MYNSEGKILLYKASAGSGKTFLLVYEYIKLLFYGQTDYILYSDSWHPNIHRTILAVTFTNKATAEMKSRIILSLDELAQHKNPLYVEWLQHDMPNLRNNLNKDKIANIAIHLLSDLLNDYTSFRVQTIDGFFQQVVRAFAVEFNLNSDYAIELDSKMVIEQAVDDMLSELGDDENSDLLKWLTDFVNDRITDGVGWNPRADILKMATNIGTEKYLTTKRTDFTSDLKHCVVELKNIKGNFESKLKRICDGAVNVWCNAGYVESDFKAHTLSFFNYEKIIQSKFEFSATFKKFAEVSEDEKKSPYFFTAAKLKQYSVDSKVVAEKISSQLIAHAQQIITLCSNANDEFIKYQTSCAILANLYVTGILSRIEKYLDKRCNREDIMVLSSVAELIKKIIDGSDTPFIYERIGAFTNHFMIDEFQDTSVLQWNNFCPLIEESISQGYESMIVGDVKQSIYRWRNGDWHILHEGVRNRFGSRVDDEELNTNFRSEYEVVRFNNFMYSHLAEKLDESLNSDSIIRFSSIYNSVEQKLPKFKEDNKCGYVRCGIIESNNEAQALEKSLDDMVDKITSLTSLRSVAVLGRTNKQLIAIAKKLMEKNIPFCSSESLRVVDNVAVKFIVSVLYLYSKPYEAVYALNMVSAYKALFYSEPISAEDHSLLLNISKIGKIDFTKKNDENYSDTWLENLFNDKFNTMFRDKFENMSLANFVTKFRELRFLPLTRCVDDIISMFCLSGNFGSVSHAQFIGAFADQIHDYSCSKNGNIVDFLNYWEAKSPNVYVPMPENSNSVIICTIHKSKGLEFDTVFIPFVNFEMGISAHSDIRFCPFPDEISISKARLPFVAIDMARYKRLLKSYFKDTVYTEYVNFCLDELNALYVATTRAKKHLYINIIKVSSSAAKKSDKDSLKKIKIADLLYNIIPAYFGNQQNSENCDNDKIDENQEQCISTFYEIGSMQTDVQSSDADTDDETDSLLDTEYPRPNSIVVEERMSVKFSNEIEQVSKIDSVRFGLVMHSLFEKINQLSDVEFILNRALCDGELSNDELEIFQRVFSNDYVASILFPNHFDVINEAEIWSAKQQKYYRPDRVLCNHSTSEAIVVDYKFGKQTSNKDQVYRKQISNYVELLNDMGYNAKGYLFYVMSNDMINIC